ncbi:MAG TPA: MCE family protein [Candidatus Avibacteroides excrementipullorum]|jgi:phospholipid/cholesterol/gamma-HCH transport system substrate-binding protein|nr:MCE family protein [Candidatus Avibacteroides excrementipullorum]
MKYFTKEVKIGLAGIVALFMLIYGLNYLKGVDIFKPSKYIYVKFSDINGLTKSSPVYANGFKVGIVSDIVYDNLHPGNIAVEVELEQDIVLPKGTSAELQAEMLGGVRMNLLFAENKGDFYAIGDTLQGANNAGLMGDLSTELMPKIVMMMPKLDSILVSLNAILADKSIPSTLSSLDATMKNLERSSASLSVLLDKDLPQAMTKLDKIEDNVVTLTDELNDANIKDTFTKINSTLADVNQFTSKLGQSDNSLGLLVNDRAFYDNLNATAENAANLLKDLKEHPKRYVHFSLFGKKDK